MQCSACGQDNPPEASFCSSCGSACVVACDIPPATVDVPYFRIGVFSSYGHAWRQLWKYFLILFLISIIAALISIPNTLLSNLEILKSINRQLGGAGVAGALFLSFAYGILLTSPIRYGVAFANLQAAKNKPLDIRDMFEAFQNYLNAILAALLVSIIIGIGFLLLIVPGIIFACKLAFVPYLVVDRFMTPVEAIKESWRLTDGHAWKVFLISLLAIPVCFAGLLFCGVGIFLAMMWVGLAHASLYYAVSSTDLSPA